VKSHILAITQPRHIFYFYVSDDLIPGDPLLISPSKMSQLYPMYVFYTVTRTSSDVDAVNVNQLHSKANK
jgi:hypothetical protein